jgi:hypothetical protein
MKYYFCGTRDSEPPSDESRADCSCPSRRRKADVA